MGLINTISSVCKSHLTIRENVKHEKRVEGRILGNLIPLRYQRMKKKEAEKEGLVGKKNPRLWVCFQGEVDKWQRCQ